VTVNVQLAVFPESSEAVQVTVVAPTGNVEPDGGEHNTVAAAEHAPVTVGVGYVTIADPEPGEDSNAVTSAGQVIAGGSLLFTVTVKLHGSPVSPAHTTWVTPTGKNDPDGGLHKTTPHVVPDGVGSG
jgi:hypothetical protein